MGKVRAMLRLVTFLLIVSLLGCGRGGVFQRGDPLPAAEGDWFCETAENSEDWACIQDAELARSPRPSRLPQPRTKVAPASQAAAAAANAAANTAEAEPGAPARIRRAVAPPPPPLPEVEATPAVVPTAAATDAGVPTHIRLAYRPDKPTSMLDLPADFYAVQLIAMTSRERLEAYIEKNQLEGMSAARVERDGGLYFVLILGIYQTRELAEQASQTIPPPLDTTEPWIRPLGALQEAMIRGDAIAGRTNTDSAAN